MNPESTNRQTNKIDTAVKQVLERKKRASLVIFNNLQPLKDDLLTRQILYGYDINSPLNLLKVDVT